MVNQAQVVAEMLRLEIYSAEELRRALKTGSPFKVIPGVEKNTFDLTLDGEEHSGLTGAEVIRTCAEARGLSVRFGRGGYKASPKLVDAVLAELQLGATHPRTDAVLEDMLGPVTGKRTERPLPKARGLLKQPAAAARAAGAAAKDLEGKRGAALIKVYELELRRWHAAKAALDKAQKDQHDYLNALQQQQKQMRELMLKAEHTPRVRQSLRQLLVEMDHKMPPRLELLEAREEEAHARCRAVWDCIEDDPAAQLQLLKKARKTGGFGVAVVVLLAVVVLAAVAAGIWAVRYNNGVQVLQALINKMRAALPLPNTLSLRRWGQGCGCGCVGAAIWGLLWRVGVSSRRLLSWLVLAVFRLVAGCCSLLWWCACWAGRLCAWVVTAVLAAVCGLLRAVLKLLWGACCWTWCMCGCAFREAVLALSRRLEPPPLNHAAAGESSRQPVCLAAAANAAAMYAATADMHTSISRMRDYYRLPLTQQHRLWRQQQQPRESSCPQPPSAAELCALVVGVSRLVQMEFGAQHGLGECHLRDKVLHLLTGLLSVEGLGVVRSEAPLAGGRSDLMITDVGGYPTLLVVEYKQRHSGQASACQQQDAAQLTRYLSDSSNGCAEGLLITFDKTLPNGLSANRLTRVTQPQAAAGGGLQRRQWRRRPAFCTQALHDLESDPWVVGVLVGLCQSYGVELQRLEE